MEDYWLSIRVLGCEDSTVDKFIHGPNTSVWHVSGEGIEEEGVLLLPKPGGIYDTPVITYWQNSSYGRIFQGFAYGNRDLQLGFQIYSGIGGAAEDWQETDSMFRLAWDFDRITRIEFETADGVRYLDCQLMSEPVSYQGAIEDGHSPFLRHDATVTMAAACAKPNYRKFHAPVEQVCESSSGEFTFDIVNDGDVDLWPKWTVSSVAGGARWVFPDYSFGNEEYLRGEQDADRTWKAPVLVAGEHTVFDSDPTVEFARSSIRSRVWDRCDGELLYPVPPHTKATVTVTFQGAAVGDSCRLTYVPEFSRPWGVSRVVQELVD